jgi:hypothetical protein
MLGHTILLCIDCMDDEMHWAPSNDIHCVLMDMHLPRKHCLTSTILEQLSDLFMWNRLGCVVPRFGLSILPLSWICRFGCSQINEEEKLVGLPSFSELSAYRPSHISLTRNLFVIFAVLAFIILETRRFMLLALLQARSDSKVWFIIRAACCPWRLLHHWCRQYSVLKRL